MAGVYKSYDHLKQRLKPLIPKWLFRRTVNGFHFLEAFAANVVYGFPSRGMRVVGVTGTNGKTTTTNLIGAVLEAAGHHVGINSTAVLQVADRRWDNDLAMTNANPFQLQKLIRQMKKANCDWVVMEAASHSLVQYRVWGIRFEAAVMTNLTRDHLDYHGTMQEYAAAKGRLFSHHPAVMVLNRDDEWFDFFDKYEADRQVTYGTHEEADCRIAEAKMGLKGTRLRLKLESEELAIRLKLPGQFNCYNAAAAAATAHALGVSHAHIVAGLEKIEAVPGRVQLIDVGQDFTVIIDHAHTTDALDNIYRTVRMLLKGRLISVIGADGDRDPGKREPIGRLAAENSQAVVVTDQEPYTEDPARIRAAVIKGVESVKHGVVHFEIADRREAIKKALGLAKKGDVVLIPGLGNQLTRGMADGKMPWDDREVTRELLQEMHHG
jgi:UDP-N-acetylmuramoyl-L-alanyl-D-glutamate--2,6-diaminopimelate ligase